MIANSRRVAPQPLVVVLSPRIAVTAVDYLDTGHREGLRRISDAGEIDRSVVD